MTQKDDFNMNVLSLFDGMSCAQIAFQKLGIPYTWYASEICKSSIKVTQSNFPNTIQLGDIRNVKAENLPKIDLIVAGSPCQGFSFAGLQLNFNDPRSALFFEFVRILRETKAKDFIFENVRMKKEFQDVITDHLLVKPIEIDSALVSAQRRKRLYWTSKNFKISQPTDRKINLQDVIDYSNRQPATDSFHRWFKGKKEERVKAGFAMIVNEKSKAATLTARMVGNYGGNIIDLGCDKYRFVSVSECEKLQNVPVGYTREASAPQAYKMLGNGMTVDVIHHLLEEIYL